MNRNTAIGLGVLALFVSAILFGPTVIEVIDDVLTPDDVMSTAVEFYDEDGNLIDVPMAITAGGQEVTTMSVTASWTVEGENIEPGTFNINVLIEIEMFNLVQMRYFHLDSHTFDSSEYVSSESHTWVLADLLPMGDQDKTDGWGLRIFAVFTPTAVDLGGEPVAPESSTTSPIDASLTWDDQAGTLSIIQCAVTKAYPP